MHDDISCVALLTYQQAVLLLIVGLIPITVEATFVLVLSRLS